MNDLTPKEMVALLVTAGEIEPGDKVIIHKTWPSIDHSLLSPSGHISELARKAALKRLHDELFPNGFPEPSCPQPTRRETLLRQVAELRGLAERGMKPRAYLKRAIELEIQANKSD